MSDHVDVTIVIDSDSDVDSQNSGVAKSSQPTGAVNQKKSQPANQKKLKSLKGLFKGAKCVAGNFSWEMPV